MVFVGYECGSKAWHFYNPSTKRMHISRDAVFKEDRAWDWGDDKPGDGAEPFIVDYFTLGGAWALRQLYTRLVAHVPREPDSKLPATPLKENRAPTPAMLRTVEHATPPAESPDLDADHDDAPRRFCTLENILGP
jgi:hypothetical protein